VLGMPPGLFKVVVLIADVEEAADLFQVLEG
jgi:hypothetical protein